MAKSGFIKKSLVRIVGFLTILTIIALLISYLSPFVSPKSIWWIQLFGLAYPVILLVYILLLPITFFLRRKRWWIMMFILLAGIPVHLRYLALSGSETLNNEKPSIKITSFNVRGFDNYQWIHKDLQSAELAFKKFITSDSADIICFQEYTKDHRSSRHMASDKIKAAGDFIDNAEQLIVQTRKLDFGVAIYSKHPIINKGNVGADHQIYSMYADIALPTDTIRVYNVHLQSIRFQQDEYSLFDDDALSNKGVFSRVRGLLGKLKRAYPGRIDQSQQILEHASNSPYPVVICGDFNEPPTSYIYSMFEDKYNDGYNATGFGIGRTYAGKIPAGRIDYIFSDESFIPGSFDIYDEFELSDHYPVSGVFQLK